MTETSPKRVTKYHIQVTKCAKLSTKVAILGTQMRYYFHHLKFILKLLVAGRYLLFGITILRRL